MDDTGEIVREVKVASEPEALLAVLRNAAYRYKRIGLEAGPLSPWLFSALAEARLPAICVETRHMRTVSKAQINKTDRNDARGLTRMMRAGLYRPVHVKTLRSPEAADPLTHRKTVTVECNRNWGRSRPPKKPAGIVAGRVKLGRRVFGPDGKTICATHGWKLKRHDRICGDIDAGLMQVPGCPLAGAARRQCSSVP